MLVVGGDGTRYVCFGGEDESERSTLTYVSYASPSEDSGTHARRREEALVLRVDDELVGRASLGAGVDFCCMRAMNPGMLSFADGDGCI